MNQWCLPRGSLSCRTGPSWMCQQMWECTIHNQWNLWVVAVPANRPAILFWWWWKQALILTWIPLGRYSLEPWCLSSASDTKKSDKRIAGSLAFTLFAQVCFLLRRCEWLRESNINIRHLHKRLTRLESIIFGTHKGTIESFDSNSVRGLTAQPTWSPVWSEYTILCVWEGTLKILQGFVMIARYQCLPDLKNKFLSTSKEMCGIRVPHAPVMDWHNEKCLAEDIDPFGMTFGRLSTLLSEDILAPVYVEHS